MSNAWPKARLGDVLTPIRREETVDAAREYQLLGVRLDGHGPFLREKVLGTETSATKLYKVAVGDFIYSRLFAWRGAFGVIEPELDGCYVSGEFPTFLPKPDKLDFRFLRYWFRLFNTLSKVNEDCSSSTPLTRNRFKEQFFLALEIPLPLLAEQRRIVASIEALATKITEANSLRQLEEQEIRSMQRGAFARIAKHAPRRPMGEVAPLIRRPVKVEIEGSYSELGIRSFGNGTFHKPALSGFELGSKRVFWIEPGDLLFSNVFAWEGAIAVSKPEDRGRVGSHRFITCVPRKDVATSQFLRFYFLTDEGLELIRAASPGGAGRNRTLGLAALEAIKVPVPPIEAQIWFDGLQAKVDTLKRLQSETAAELDAMLPAILDRAFKGELL